MRESGKAKQAWDEYSTRRVSLSDLCAEYRERAAQGQRVPTVHLSTLKAWSATFGWQQRLEEAERLQHERDVQAREERRRAALADDLTEEFGRLEMLTQRARAIFTDIQDKGFSEPKERQLRCYLDDIAKETGGRKQASLIDITLRIREEARELGLDPDAAVEAAQDLIRSLGAGR